MGADQVQRPHLDVEFLRDNPLAQFHLGAEAAASSVVETAGGGQSSGVVGKTAGRGVPPASPRLRVVACTIARPRKFVAAHHRHLGPPVSGLFAVGIARGDDLVGVAIVGRPVARKLQTGDTAEVTRVCTLGDRNACSMLLAACRRGAAALGYRRLVTYTLSSEPGTSLRAAGWQQTAKVRGRSWSCASRPRAGGASPDKCRWEAPLPVHAGHPNRVEHA